MSEYCETLACFSFQPCSKHQRLADETLSAWEYVNEGAVNMVFRYVSKHPKLHLRAIRLSKNVLANPFSAEHARVVQVGHEYTEHVISKLLGPEYVDAGEVVWMSVSAALDLVLASTPLRLQSRLRVHPLEQMRGACKGAAGATIPVLVMLDMAHLPGGGLPDRPTFSIEIKPKWGFLPHSPFINDEHHVKRHVCRYCMMQLHKAKETDGGIASRFCPLDVYSGNKSRVCRALCNLIKNPQNNFRVAWRSPKGARVHQALPSSSPEAFEEALKVLFDKPEGCGRDLLGPFVELVAALILNPFTSRLMRRLQQTQIDFDMFDIEGTRHLYDLLLNRSTKPSTEEAVQWTRRAVQVYREAGKLDRELWKPHHDSAHRYFASSESHPFSLHYASLSSSSTLASPSAAFAKSSSLPTSPLSSFPFTSSLSPVCNNASWLSSMAAHAALDSHEDSLWQTHSDSEREVHNEAVVRVPDQLQHHSRLSALLQSRQERQRKGQVGEDSESELENNHNCNNNVKKSSDNSNSNSSNSNNSVGEMKRNGNNRNETSSEMPVVPVLDTTSWSNSIHDDLVLAVAEFLISSTVKDLSLMFTFQLQESEGKSQVLWRMCAIDLDPKDPKKIPHHHTLDRDIVQHYLLHCKPQPQPQPSSRQ